ncbi:MAG: ATP-binding cassette domain-containing protein [Syntrophaceae bacterium]|nr:ATP-binding cassette domain-containing protein [Syntrophaceae bacterium]
MIEVIHVSKSYEGNPKALFDISFRVEKGQFVYLFGPNGAGKSTLLKILYAAERPTEGEVWVNGLNLVRMKPRKIPSLRRTLGLVFQDLKLLQRRTALENLAFALEALGAERGEISKKANQALRLVGLERRSGCLPSELSAGEQQRLAVARAIINDPILLLADEPTGNLSLTAAEETIRLFEKINLRGTTVVLATHNAGLVDLWPKQKIVLERGRLIEGLNSDPVVQG